jgi:hypothetical protein
MMHYLMPQASYLLLPPSMERVSVTCLNRIFFPSAKVFLYCAQASVCYLALVVSVLPLLAVDPALAGAADLSR